MTSGFEFYINIENNAGQVLGDGPITSASGWTYTARMDRAGSFSFSVPASDPKATLVQRKRVARAYALLGNTWTEVGAGIIDTIERQPQPDGTVILRVSGDDLIRELNYRSVLDLKIYFNNLPISHAAALNAVAAYAPPGWNFAPDSAPPNPLLYGRFNGHSVLAALIKIAEKSESHFYRSSGRNIVFTNSFAPSGVRAIQAGPSDLAPETAAIKSLTQQVNTYDLITRIYPRGSGNGDVQLTLRATTRTAPPGFVLNKTANYIESTAATASYGRIEQQVDFREIGPIENTTSDIQAAANMLFDAALEELRRRSAELEQATYTITLDQCSTLLRPLQAIFVDYSDPDAGLTVRQALNILEATWSVDNTGVRTTGLIVSNADRWPVNDTMAIVDSIEQAFVYQALPQLNANSYTTNYRFNLDSEETGEISFDFGPEVVQLQRVHLKFRLLAFESTVKSVGGFSSGAGALPTSGPSVDATGSGGVLNTGSGGPTATGSGGPTATGSGGPTATASGGAGNTGSGGPTATGSGGPTATGSGGGGNTGSGGPTATGSGGAGNTGSGGPTSTGSGGGGNTGSTSGATGSPQGGDIVSAGRHAHGLGVGAYTGSGGHLVYLIPNGSNSQLQAAGATGTVPINVSGDHTHAVNSHTHSVSAHSHSLDAHTHAIDGHTHTVTAHTHSISAHTHTVTAHTHSIAAHTHSVSAHSHSLDAHTHSISSHTHTIDAHTHSLAQHTHTLSDHAHDLADAITTVYGIFRESPSNTYSIGDLEYRVNSGAWAPLSGAIAQGGGWYLLDITNSIMNADSFRPLHENNTLAIRTRKAATATAITSIEGVGGGLLIQPTGTADPANVGKLIVVDGTTNYDGVYRIHDITLSHVFYVIYNVNNDGPVETTGTIELLKTVTVDALLSVRNIIQSIAFN